MPPLGYVLTRLAFDFDEGRLLAAKMRADVFESAEVDVSGLGPEDHAYIAGRLAQICTALGHAPAGRVVLRQDSAGLRIAGGPSPERLGDDDQGRVQAWVDDIIDATCALLII